MIIKRIIFFDFPAALVHSLSSGFIFLKKKSAVPTTLEQGSITEVVKNLKFKNTYGIVIIAIVFVDDINEDESTGL